jgi:hypothetical protein
VFPYNLLIALHFTCVPGKQGLASLLAGGAVPEDATPEMRDEILRRTRVFYFNKQTGFNLSMDEAREYEASLLSALSTAGISVAEATAPASDNTVSPSAEERVLTFAELKDLIESGKVDQIPNNKLIPEKFSVSSLTMIELPETLPHLAARRRNPPANLQPQCGRNLGRPRASRVKRHEGRCQVDSD